VTDSSTEPGRPHRAGRSSHYRGWSVAAGGFLCAMLSVGGSIYIFTLFVLPVVEAFSLSRADANNAMILLMLGMATWSPIIGRLLDTFSARMVMCIAAFLYAAGFLIIGSSSSLVAIGFAIFGPMAMGVSGAGAMAANTVVARWFRRRRGRAIGILAVATSAGGFVMVPIVSKWIEDYGWRNALMITGVGVASLILASVLLLIRDRPRAADLEGFDEFEDSGTGDGAEPEADGEDWGFASLSRSRNFWLLTLGAGLLLASDQAILTSKAPYLRDAGVSAAATATFISAMTLSAIFGKLLVGFLADRFDIRRLFGGVVVCQLALLTVLIVQPDYWVLLGAASIFGMAVGGVYPVWLSLTATVFGARSYGTIMGSMALVMQPISMGAVRFVGEAHDRTGSYDLAFYVFMGMALVAYFLISLISLPND
jgi:sugar phosphate permease